MVVGWILSKFFIERAFSEEAKKFGDRIVSDIKAQFIKKLQVTEWMSKDVRQKGIEKGKKSLLSFSNAWELDMADCFQSAQYCTKDRLPHEESRRT